MIKYGAMVAYKEDCGEEDTTEEDPSWIHYPVLVCIAGGLIVYFKT